MYLMSFLTIRMLMPMLMFVLIISDLQKNIPQSMVI